MHHIAVGGERLTEGDKEAEDGKDQGEVVLLELKQLLLVAG